MDNIIDIGLRQLMINDGYLLEKDINERSITHKLAEHYKLLFPGWDVDCEFNRNLDGPKEIEIDPQAFLLQMAAFLDKESESKQLHDYSILREEDVSVEDVISLRDQLRDSNNLVYDEELDLVAFVLRDNDNKKIIKPIFPDIIIHHRGTRENLVVIEAKKSSNKNRKARLYDLVKLNVLTRDAKYSYGHAYFIDIPTKTAYSRHSQFRVSPYPINSSIRIIDSF